MTIERTRQLAIRFGLCTALAVAMAGCHKDAQATTGNAAEQNGSDPAAVNMAAENGQPAQVLAQNVQYAPQQQGQDYTPAYDNGQDSYNDDNLTDWQASEPPPPLPEYEQPPDPDPNYLWTPGYWAWSPEGYYWVPGYWVAPPYVGALWTPGYWGFYGGRYRFHHGYWGRYVGFYGGIDYGFGYFGLGYDGGYWNGPNFYYNTAVTRVNRDSVRYVYQRNEDRGDRGSARVSFNGGRGGVQVQPRAAEVTAMRGQRVGPMQSQTQVEHQASQNRQQFYSANHGRPAAAVAAQPVGRDRSLPAALPSAAGPRGGGGAGRNGAQPGQIQGPVQQGAPRGGSAPEAVRPGQQGRPGIQPGVQEARPVQPQNEARPQQQTPQLQQRVQPQQQVRPQVQQPQPQATPNVQRGQGRPDFQRQQAAPQQQARPQEQIRQQGPPQRQAAPQPQPQRQAPPQQAQPQHQAPPQAQHTPPQQPHQQAAPSPAHGDGHGNGNDKKQ